MTTSSSVTLFRPVGQNEHEKIAHSSWGRFPPRLEEQPIFYPVLNQPYAEQIARDWNTRGGKVGSATAFEIDRDYVSRFEVQQVGNESHVELWVDAQELEEFNDHLHGPIRVTSVFIDGGSGGIRHPGLSQRLLARIVDDFGAEGAEAIRVLATATTHDGLPSAERLAASIVLASRRDVEQLKGLAQLLAVDYRDVLVAGPLAHDNWRDVLDLELGSEVGS